MQDILGAKHQQIAIKGFSSHFVLEIFTGVKRSTAKHWAAADKSGSAAFLYV